MGILSSLFGIGGSKPKQETVVQSAQIPPELAPFVKQILGEAQDLYEGEIERGYDPYTGLTSAPFTAEEEAAQAGIAGLVGTATPYIEEAVGTYREGAEKFTPETAQEYMSPYQRAVTDIEKREAQRVFERDVMPRFEAEAVEAGGLSGLGTRAGVQAAELQRNQQQLLADIETKGLQSAFQDARQAFETQKARERQMAGDVGRTGPALFQAGLAERGAQMGVGEQKRQQAQTGLDEAYFRFLEERGFPQQTLADYSQTVYGNPVLGTPSVTRQTTEQPFVASPASQLMGLGLSGLNLYGMGGGFNPGGFSMGNLYARPGMGAAAQGGQVESTLPVIKRAAGTTGANAGLNLGMFNLGQFLPTLATQAQTSLGRMSPPKTEKGIKSSLGKKFDSPYLENLYKNLIGDRKTERSLAADLRANAIARAQKQTEGAREDYFPKAREEATKINVGGELGAELRKDRPEGETPVDLLRKSMAAMAEGAGDQILSNFDKVAKLNEKEYAEKIKDITDLKTEELTQLDNESKANLVDIETNFNASKEIAGLEADETAAVSKLLKESIDTENKLLEPAKTYATILSAIGSTLAKRTGKAFPSFNAEAKMIDRWAAENTTGVTFIPDPNNPDKYILGGIDGTPLKSDSEAMKQYQQKRAEGMAQLSQGALSAQAAGNDPRAAMLNVMNNLMGITVSPITNKNIPYNAIRDLVLRPTADAKREFDDTFGTGMARKILGHP
jgi:hypothetical protein